MPCLCHAERLQLWLPVDHGGKLPDLCQDRLLQGREHMITHTCMVGCDSALENLCVWHLLVPQGNITAIKYVNNKKRIELTRKVLFELKHVSSERSVCVCVRRCVCV